MTYIILHAEDDPTVRDVFKRWAAIVQKEIDTPIEVISAPDGIEAISLYDAARRQGRNIELVVTDYNMPRANGANVVMEIRTRDPRVPIIFQCSEAQIHARDFNTEYAEKGMGDLRGLLLKYASPKPRVLVVDDEQDIRDCLAEDFAEKGYMPVLAANAEDALQELHTVHAVVSDVNQPDSIGGYGLLGNARARYSPEQLPFFLMSGNETDIEKCIQFAAFPMKKPFEFSILETLLRNALPEHLKPKRQQ